MTRGKRVISDEVREEMACILEEIQTGEFAREWILENMAGRPVYNAIKREESEHMIEIVGRRAAGHDALAGQVRQAGVGRSLPGRARAGWAAPARAVARLGRGEADALACGTCERRRRRLVAHLCALSAGRGALELRYSALACACATARRVRLSRSCRSVRSVVRSLARRTVRRALIGLRG